MNEIPHLINIERIYQDTLTGLNADLVELEATIDERRQDIRASMSEVQRQIDLSREAIVTALRAANETSYTDSRTGITARIERRTSWKVAGRDELFAAAKEAWNVL